MRFTTPYQSLGGGIVHEYVRPGCLICLVLLSGCVLARVCYGFRAHCCRSAPSADPARWRALSIARKHPRYAATSLSAFANSTSAASASVAFGSGGIGGGVAG